MSTRPGEELLWDKGNEQHLRHGVSRAEIDEAYETSLSGLFPDAQGRSDYRRVIAWSPTRARLITVVVELLATPTGVRRRPVTAYPAGRKDFDLWFAWRRRRGRQ